MAGTPSHSHEQIQLEAAFADCSPYSSKHCGQVYMYICGMGSVSCGKKTDRLNQLQKLFQFVAVLYVEFVENS